MAGATETQTDPDHLDEEISARFTEAQIVKYKTLFDMFDINKDGRISLQEMEVWSKKLGYKLTQDKLQEIIQRWDLQKKGSIGFSEYLKAMPANEDQVSTEEHRVSKLRLKFYEFDKDNNGYVTAEDAHDILTKELAFPKYKTRAYIKYFDKNADGKLNIEEFADFYGKISEKKDELKLIFNDFDRNRDGFVDIGEAQDVLTEFDFSREEVEAMVLEHDKDGDKKLNFEEFVQFWSLE